MVLDSCQNFFILKGFGNVIRRAQGKSSDFILKIIQRAEKDDRDIVCFCIRFQPRTDLVSVHIWHSDI